MGAPRTLTEVDCLGKNGVLWQKNGKHRGKASSLPACECQRIIMTRCWGGKKKKTKKNCHLAKKKKKPARTVVGAFEKGESPRAGQKGDGGPSRAESQTGWKSRSFETHHNMTKKEKKKSWALLEKYKGEQQSQNKHQNRKGGGGPDFLFGRKQNLHKCPRGVFLFGGKDKKGKGGEDARSRRATKTVKCIKNPELERSHLREDQNLKGGKHAAAWGFGKRLQPSEVGKLETEQEPKPVSKDKKYAKNQGKGKAVKKEDRPPHQGDNCLVGGRQTKHKRGGGTRAYRLSEREDVLRMRERGKSHQQHKNWVTGTHS